VERSHLIDDREFYQLLEYKDDVEAVSTDVRSFGATVNLFS
jgi:hypothetical protein